MGIIDNLKNNVRGFTGELGVGFVLNLVGKNSYVINNLMFENQGKSIQIDHVLINETGVFVIETKNYAGYISGYENSQEWTQTLAYGKIKNKFYNPIKQNKSHVYHLKYLLNNPKVMYFPIVVFTGKVDVLNVQWSETPVLFPNQVRGYIRGIFQNNLSPQEVEEIHSKLEDIKKNNTITKKEHIESIKVEQSKIEANICPRCGGSLVLRHGKNGDFYGCSNYPKCSFTKKK